MDKLCVRDLDSSKALEILNSCRNEHRDPESPIVITGRKFLLRIKRTDEHDRTVTKSISSTCDLWVYWVALVMSMYTAFALPRTNKGGEMKMKFRAVGTNHTSVSYFEAVYHRQRKDDRMMPKWIADGMRSTGSINQFEDRR